MLDVMLMEADAISGSMVMQVFDDHGTVSGNNGPGGKKKPAKKNPIARKSKSGSKAGRRKARSRQK